MLTPSEPPTPSHTLCNPPHYPSPHLPPPPAQKKDKRKGKKRKDPTSDRSIESLFAELVSNGILQPCPHAHVRDYLGSPAFMQATLEKVCGGGWRPAS